MLALEFIFMILGFAFFASAAILVACDVFAATRLRWLLRRNHTAHLPTARHHRPTLLWVARTATLEERP
jgi:hypothetical protein